MPAQTTRQLALIAHNCSVWLTCCLRALSWVAAKECSICIAHSQAVRQACKLTLHIPTTKPKLWLFARTSSTSKVLSPLLSLLSSNTSSRSSNNQQHTQSLTMPPKPASKAPASTGGKAPASTGGKAASESAPRLSEIERADACLAGRVHWRQGRQGHKEVYCTSRR